jgi:two-component system chemotaxis response regulator CheY
MQILATSQRLLLLEYMALLKYRLAEWLIVEAKVTNLDKADLNSEAVATLFHKAFGDYEGRILICNPTEVLMFIEWGKDNSPQKLSQKISAQLPADICETKVVPPTKEGLKRIELMITPTVIEKGTLFATRLERQNNVFLIADDDMYIRTLAKKALQDRGTVFEVGEGQRVAEAYTTHNPDLVLLDIHMPGHSGDEVLNQLKGADPKAHIIMLSADSSVENIQYTKQHGAKGFLAKPFNKARLLEFVEGCPTVK